MCIDPHQTGFVCKGSDQSSWLNFGRPAPPGRGSAAGRKFLAWPYYSQHAVFVSVWALFRFFIIFLRHTWILTYNGSKDAESCNHTFWGSEYLIFKFDPLLAPKNVKFWPRIKPESRRRYVDACMWLHIRCVYLVCWLCCQDQYILKMHIKMRHMEPDVLFQCNLCSKMFTRKAHLKRHLRIHNPDKPYKCPHCPYRLAVVFLCEKRLLLKLMCFGHADDWRMAVLKHLPSVLS